MSARAPSSSVRSGVALAISLLLGCGKTASQPPNHELPSGGQTAGGGAGPVAIAGGGAATCDGDSESAWPAKRLVRLSLTQVKAAIAGGINASLAEDIGAHLELQPRDRYGFLALQEEGTEWNEPLVTKLDEVAQQVGQYVFDHLDSLAGCGQAPTDACAQDYLLGFAKRAFRRPLADDEQARLLSRYAAFRSTSPDVTVALAIQYGVYALLMSPQFSYRSELGADAHAAGPLTSFETASLLSYFLTDTDPDSQLLQAAADDALSTPDAIGAQVDRIIRTDAAQANLESVMRSYLQYRKLAVAVIDDAEFSADLRRAMNHEGELFLHNSLWSGSLGDLLLSRTTYLNAGLSALYGLSEFPSSGATLDASGFARVALPRGRTGLLTQPALLVAIAEPDGHDAVSRRGHAIQQTWACASPLPDLPQDRSTAIATALTELGLDATGRAPADLLATFPECRACHELFDPYGIALERFDVLGRYRVQDPQGRAIDTSTHMPTAFGGDAVQDITEVAGRLVASGAPARCLTYQMIQYALTNAPSNDFPSADSCVVARVAESFDARNASFVDVLRAVATSEVFTQRGAGEEAP